MYSYIDITFHLPCTSSEPCVGWHVNEWTRNDISLKRQAYRIYPVHKVMRIFGQYQIPGLIGLLWWQADGYCDLMKNSIQWVYYYKR